jgi:hypothetical protein
VHTQPHQLTIINSGIELGLGSKWIQNGNVDIQTSVMSNGMQWRCVTQRPGH